MKDGFDAKHEMVQHLLSMLKDHAVGEVEGGMHKPEAPHGMPGHDPKCMDPKMCSGGMAKMSDGGMALATDEPENVMPASLPEEPGASHPEPKMGEIEEEDEDNNSSAFGMFRNK